MSARVNFWPRWQGGLWEGFLMRSVPGSCLCLRTARCTHVRPPTARAEAWSLPSRVVSNRTLRTRHNRVRTFFFLFSIVHTIWRFSYYLINRFVFVFCFLKSLAIRHVFLYCVACMRWHNQQSLHNMKILSWSSHQEPQARKKTKQNTDLAELRSVQCSCSERLLVHSQRSTEVLHFLYLSSK